MPSRIAASFSMQTIRVPEIEVRASGVALDDRQAKAEAAGDPRALLEAVEFLEDLAALDRRNADTGVVDADLERGAAAAAADQHAPARGIFDRIGDQVLQQPSQQETIRLDGQRARHEHERQILGACDRRELDLQRAHQIGHLEA
jgi:hypothetical protein